MKLIALLIERSIEALHKHGVRGMPDSCEIEQHNYRVWSVSLDGWIVFLDTKSGEPEVYHSLPLLVWNG